MESREKSVIRISVKREKAGKKESHLPCRRKIQKCGGRLPTFTTTRGISRTVLSEFIKRRMIYEDRKYHNAVFVGYDKSGVARHAHKHGTFTGGRHLRAMKRAATRNTVFTGQVRAAGFMCLRHR